MSVATFIGCVALGPTASAASFDCTKATTNREYAICADEQLSDLDSRVGQLYKSALGQLAPPGAERLRNEQRIWLVHVGQACPVPSPQLDLEKKRCLQRVYQDRIADLQAASARAPTPRVDPSCDAGNELENNECRGDRLQRYGAELATYVVAARKRLKAEAAMNTIDAEGARKAQQNFDEAEAAWTKYRDAECTAVYAHLAAGSIRNSAHLQCLITLTRSHTHTVWSLWLTYFDDTPPILPEPTPVRFP